MLIRSPNISRREALAFGIGGLFGAAALGFAGSQGVESFHNLVEKAKAEIEDMKRRMLMWSPDQKPADAIAVFTGSKNRIPAAFSLWQPGQEILITSCDPCQSKKSFLLATENAHIPPDVITIDYDAQHTFGNAAFVSQTLKERSKLKSITLVTEETHGPRARYYLEKQLPPGVALNFCPVKEDRTQTDFDAEARKLLRQKILVETGQKLYIPMEPSIIPREDSLRL